MEFKDLINKEELQIHDLLTEYALELGYKKTIAKTKDVIHVYLHPKTKERILKFSYSKKSGFLISLKFNQTKEYSYFFHEAIRKTIEESNLRYTGCYNGCTRCDGTKGYIYTYPNGKSYFRCYIELIELPGFTSSNIDETKILLKNQL